MTEPEKRALVARLRAGKDRARRLKPQRIKELERQLEELGAEFRAHAPGSPRRIELIRDEIPPVSARLHRMKWGSQ